MNKRKFLNMSLAMMSSLSLRADPATSQEARGSGSEAVRGNHPAIVDAGVEFTWRHEADRVRGTLTAPTDGWIAVGFNEISSLRNTWFVIAAVSASPIRAEEHIALVPAHKNIADLGLEPGLEHVSGYYRDGRSRLEFSLPHTRPKRPSLRLDPGAGIYLMLAWSHEPDFDHHSAWRRHYDIVL